MTVTEINQIIKEKVEGVWEACHDQSGHRYRNTKTGYIQRSVTTKLGDVISKPHLIKWAITRAIEWLLIEDRMDRIRNPHWRDEMVVGAQMAHTDTRDDAGSVGTQAHNAAERYINQWIAQGFMPESIQAFARGDEDPRAIASMRAVEQFFQKNPIVPIASELLVGDDRYSAGTLDLLCLINGQLSIIDFKTSNGIDQLGYSMQVAAYKAFFEKMTGLKIKQCKILHLSKSYDKFSVYRITNTAKAFTAFKHLCAIYDWKNDKKEKIISDIKRIKI